MKRMFDWIIKVRTSVLDTKKEILAKLNKLHNVDIPLDRYVVLKSVCKFIPLHINVFTL